MRSRAGTLKSHFTVNAAVTAALVLAISAVGIWSIVKLSSALERTTIASMAIRNHMGADMMHDALRADVLAAVLAGQSGSDADKQGVKADLKEHVAAFENFLGENAALTLSTTIKAALDNLKTPLAAYIAKASDMVDLATSNPAAAAPRMPEFMDAFSNLESAMETTSQAIEADIESNTAVDAEMARVAIISMVAALVAGLAFVVLAGFLLRRAIVPPVLALTTVMGRLAEGDASLEVPGTERQNEIGRMARSVEVFKQNAKENERLRLEQETLKTKTEADRRTQRQQLADDFERKVGSMVRAVSLAAEEVRGAAESMSETADRTNSQAESVAASSEETAASVQTVAAATEELAASIMEIGRQVERSATIAEQAVGEAERSDQIIAGLAEGANRIGEIVGLITDIAEQTNLLALNATIEAARAGDAGRGFAVVASEVKGLAGQTAKATDEISGKVREVGDSVQLVIDAVRAIGGTIREINQTATAISTAVDQQQSATQEISSSVGHAARGTKDVSASIVGVRRDASSAGSAAGKILGVAERLSQHAAQLSTEVDGFIAEMKAA